MVVLTCSAGFVILEKEKPVVMLAAGLLCQFPGSEESEADGDGGFLCCFLRSGDWFWRKEADGYAALQGS